MIPGTVVTVCGCKASVSLLFLFLSCCVLFMFLWYAVFHCLSLFVMLGGSVRALWISLYPPQYSDSKGYSLFYLFYSLSRSLIEVLTSRCLDFTTHPVNPVSSYWKSVSAAVSTFMVLSTNIKVLHAKCFVAVLLSLCCFLNIIFLNNRTVQHLMNSQI